MELLVDPKRLQDIQSYYGIHTTKIYEVKYAVMKQGGKHVWNTRTFFHEKNAKLFGALVNEDGGICNSIVGDKIIPEVSIQLDDPLYEAFSDEEITHLIQKNEDAKKENGKKKTGTGKSGMDSQ